MVRYPPRFSSTINHWMLSGLLGDAMKINDQLRSDKLPPSLLVIHPLPHVHISGIGVISQRCVGISSREAIKWRHKFSPS